MTSLNSCGSEWGICETTIGFSNFCKTIRWTANINANSISYASGKTYPIASCGDNKNYNINNVCTDCPSECTNGCEEHTLRCNGHTISFDFVQLPSTIERPSEIRFRIYPIINGSVSSEKLTFKFEDVLALQSPEDRKRIIYCKTSYNS